MSGCENILNNLSEDQKQNIKDQIEMMLENSPLEKSAGIIRKKIEDLAAEEAEKYLSTANAIKNKTNLIDNNYKELKIMNQQLSRKTAGLQLTPRDMLLSMFEQGHENHFSDSKLNLQALINNNIDNNLNNITKQIRQSNNKELKQAWDLLTDFAFTKEKIQRQEALGVDVLKEFAELNAKKDAQVGITKNKEAQEIAKLIHNQYDNLMKEGNKLGIKINKLDRYIGRQTHGKEVIFKKGKEWLEFMDKNLDFERTFGNVKEGERATLLNDLKSSILDDTINFIEYKGDGKELFNKRFNQHREIFFKDFNSQIEYNRLFSNGNIFQNLVHTIENLARSNVITKEWGLMPHLSISESLNYLNKIAKDDFPPSKMVKVSADLTGIRSGNTYSEPVVSAINQAFGQFKVGNLGVARAMSNVRKYNSLTIMGRVMMSTLTDHANFMARNFANRDKSIVVEAMKLPVNILGHFKDMIVKNKSQSFKEIQEFADSFNIALDNTRMQMQRFMLDGVQNESKGGMTAVLNKMTENLYNWNLLNRDLEIKALNVSHYLGRELFKDSKKGFDNIGKKTAQTLKEYGFNKEDFVLITKAQKIAEEKGLKVIPSDIIYQVGDVSLEQAKALESKISNYFREEANTIYNFHSSKARRTLTANTAAGTGLGEVARNIASLKSYGFMQFENMYKSILTNPALSRSDVFKGFGGLIFASYSMSLTQLMLGDIVDGKTPRSLTEQQTHLDALERSSIFGIVGEVAMSMAPSRKNKDFGQYSLSKATFNLLGPVPSKAHDLGKIISEGITDKLDTDRATTFIRNNIPYQNLFYVKAMLSEFMYSMGLIDKSRMAKIIQDNYDQRFLID